MNPRTLKAREERLGMTNCNNQGESMEIIEYNSNCDITIKFANGTIVYNKSFCNFIKGKVFNPFFRKVYGVGYLGMGKHTSQQKKKHTFWANMLSRCYLEKRHKHNPTYKNCSVCEEWHNFQNFGDWYDENHYEIPGEKMCLDKDILQKGNKLYSPETCVFVPKSINNLVVNRVNDRGDCLVGVYYKKDRNKYVARISKNGKTHVIGSFGNEYDAFLAYKREKEAHIKQVADKYQIWIPQKLYDAMYRWEIHETD